jgi:ankyrin repeat protein
MKASELNNDFYTDKINEGSKSIIDKGNKLINNLPQPFVKPLKTQFININLNHDSDEETFNVKKLTSKNEPQPQIKKIPLTNKKIPAKDLFSTTDRLQSSNNESQKLEKENSIEFKNEGIQLDMYQRKLQISAKKGDRDGFLESLEIILGQEKGDINFKDESGWTALHHACDEGNLKIVDILINTNADINCKTNNKKTPLHLTTAHGYFDISKLLVENGCVINSVDDEKNTPIHICSSTGHLELLKYLLDRFPLADLKNIYGKKPIDLAKKDDIKNLLNEYLKKNESQYTKVHIHSTNQKSVNNFLKNFNSNNHNTNYPNYRNTETSPNNPRSNNNYVNIKTAPSNTSQKNIKTPIKGFNHTNNHNNPNNPNIAQIMKNTIGDMNSSAKGHGKFQSNDFNNKISTAFQNNSNININISTNINHPSGNINVVNVNNNPNTKQIKINDKVKVTVETQVSPNASNKNSNKQSAHNHAGLKFNSYNTNNQVNKSTIKTPNYKNVASNFNTSRNSNLQNNKNLENDNNAAGEKIPKIEDSSGKKETSRVIKVNLNNPIEESVNQIKNTEKETDTKRVEIVDYSLSNNIEPFETKENISNNQIEENFENSRSQSCSQNQTLSQSQSLSQSHSQNLSQSHSQSQSISNANITNNKSNTESVEGDSGMNSVSIDEERIGPQTFICHALVGKGSFGEVYLVEKRNTKILYAMKVLSKDKIMAQNLIKYAMTERNVLSITNHPFIVKLNFSFQTSDKLFLILDYCPGGDLAEHLARENRFSEQRAKIYLCEIILALEDLHKRDIIFRDLKPDNVVLDEEGHAQLTDFGLSKEGVLDSKSAKSFCG